MNKLPIAIFALLLSLPAVSLPVFAAEGFASLEEQMTGKEFSASGLEKLTPAELEALNEWIRGHSVATLDAPKQGYSTVQGDDEDGRGFENKNMQMERVTIQSRIKGKFTGWDGKTVFELENGMIWEQVDKDKFFIREVENPEVNIEPGAFRTWHISVEGYGSECRVERIQ